MGEVLLCVAGLESLSCGFCCMSFFFQAEDGIRSLVRSRGLGDVYKRQPLRCQEKMCLRENLSLKIR